MEEIQGSIKNNDLKCKINPVDDERDDEKSEIIFEIVKMILCAGFTVLTFAGFLSANAVLLLRVFAAITVGYPLVIKAIEHLIKGNVFDENTLMLIATVTAFILGESFEGVLIVFLYDVGEFAEDFATDRARDKSERRSLRLSGKRKRQVR